MILALKDIRFKLGRFLLTTAGISLLLMVVMGMGGIYRGLIAEATLLIDRADADIWVVQKDTRGPFAEVSKLPRNMEYRIAAMEGIKSARPFVSHTVQRDYHGRVLRMTIQGVPDDGHWLPLLKGRPMKCGHYEMLADQSAKLPLGTKLKLGKDHYKVVGITDRMNAPSGDAMVFVSLNDALNIQNDLPPEAIRAEREARLERFDAVSFGSTAIDHGETLRSSTVRPVALPGQRISAVLVTVRDGWSVENVLRHIRELPDVSAYTADGEREIMLGGFVARSRKQIKLFRTILLSVSTVVITLVLYMLTLDKIHDIAMLKLLGARNRVMVSMIFTEALFIGIIALGIARFLGQWAYPLFPRRVVLVSSDVWMLLAIVVGMSLTASIAGVVKALLTDTGEVLS